LVHELLRTLAADRVVPSATSAPLVGLLGSDTVAQSTLLRVARLHPSAVGVTRAVAVLGSDATLSRVAQLAGAQEHLVLEAVDAPAAALLLTRGPPLECTLPLVRASLYTSTHRQGK